MYRPHVSKFEASGSPAANGTWWYETGVDGGIVIPQGVYVVSIRADASGPGASVQVSAMGAIPIPAGGFVTLNPNGGFLGNGVTPITFVGTDSFVIEVVL